MHAEDSSKALNMRFELTTHPGVILVDPMITVVETMDRPLEETFTPSLLIEQGDTIRIFHVLPPQPYKYGTWTDSTVAKAVQDYLASIDQDAVQ